MAPGNENFNIEQEKSQIDPGILQVLKDTQKKVSDQAEQMRWMQFISYSIVVVVALAFIAMIFTVFGIIQDYMINRNIIYQELLNKIDEESHKIDAISEELKQIQNEGTSSKKQ